MIGRPTRIAIGITSAGLVLAACGSSERAVTPPTPHGNAAAACRTLHMALPGTVDGEKASATKPASPYTAAWGDIVLRCGVAKPTVDPTAQLFTIDGVDWYETALPAGGSRFTTVGRVAVVAVDVPGTHSPEADALVDLGPAINRSVLKSGDVQ